ncbi:TonB-dependent receptor plug domain-containing protein [Pseudomaricurvus sp.]|uniref:TonB-dependent receptor plug domain-containing protein n=1 Tax=Pseudomaricurvus sp. TaxID=2004510 RepID=UPI003F6B3E3A
MNVMNRKKHPLAIAISAALSGLIISTSALAQSAKSEAEALEEVVVTGTHIKGLDLEGALPAVQINRDDIKASGAKSVVDLLSNLSVTGGGTGTFSTSNAGTQSGDTPVGASAVSLRGLGTSSTLTLINGRRAAVSSFAKGSESFVDVNSIPLAAIERVEILPSGASATYGADAVAGVINYIMREDYEGTELTVDYGNSSASSDEGEYNVNFLWGKNTENTNTTVIIDYYERNAMAYNDRQRLIDADPWGSSRSPFVDAWFVGNYGNQGTDEDCPMVNGTSFGPECRDLPNAYLNVFDDFESLSSMVSFNADFENFTWFNELMYSTTESTGRSTPSTWRLNVATDNPGLQNDTDLIASVLDSNRGDLDADNYAGFTDDLINGLGTPGGIDDAIFEMDNYGDGFMRINGRFPDAREFEVESETYRLVTGLKGEAQGWSWETALTYGHNENKQRASQGYYVREMIQNGLLGTLCSDGTILQGSGGRIVDIGDGDTIELDNEPPLSPGGQYIDTSVTCENSGNGDTLWYDPFNGQQTAGNDIFKTEAKRSGESNMLSWDLTVSNPELFEMPAGFAAAAFGLEYRKEDIEDTPAGITVANDQTNDPVWNFAGTSADYDRQSFSAFFEVMTPLAENLELTFAGRYDEYDDFGSDFNPMVRLRYQPSDSLILRANWSTSFRAPSLSQAGQGTRLTSATFVCDSLSSDLMNPVAGATNANFCDGLGTAVDDIDGQSETLNTEELGSNQLKAEEAETFGFGLLYKFNEDISVTADWWRIEYDDLVSSFTSDVEQSWIENAIRQGDYTLGSNLSDLDSGTAGVLIDDSTGEIIDSHFQLYNTGFQNVEGVDLTYTQYIDTDNYGTFTLLFDASYLTEYEELVCETCDVDQLAGEFSYARWKANGGIRWSKGGWRAGLFANYVHSYNEDGADDRFGGPTETELAEIGKDVNNLSPVSSWTVWDLNIGYEFEGGSYFSINVDNLFDREAPTTYSTYDGVDFYNHNVNGRFISAGYTHVF